MTTNPAPEGLTENVRLDLGVPIDKRTPKAAPPEDIRPAASDDVERVAPNPLTQEVAGLCERIRNRANDAPMPTEHLLDEAADMLERLDAEVVRKDEMLTWIADICNEEMDLEYTEAMRKILLRNIADAARKAIGGNDEG